LYIVMVTSLRFNGNPSDRLRKHQPQHWSIRQACVSKGRGVYFVEFGRESADTDEFADAEIRFEIEQTRHRLLCILLTAIPYVACHDKRITRQELRIDVKAALSGFRRGMVSPGKEIAKARRHFGGKSKRVQGAETEGGLRLLDCSVEVACEGVRSRAEAEHDRRVRGQ